MSFVTLRPKGQLTIPVSILQQWGIKPYEQLEVNFQNGIVTIIPVKRKDSSSQNRLMEFAGAGSECWGETPDEINDSINALRDSWAR